MILDGEKELPDTPGSGLSSPGKVKGVENQYARPSPLNLLLCVVDVWLAEGMVILCIRLYF